MLKSNGYALIPKSSLAHPQDAHTLEGCSVTIGHIGAEMEPKPHCRIYVVQSQQA